MIARVWPILAAVWLLASPARADDASCVAATEASLGLRKQGKLHDALKQLAACADASCPAEIKAECSRRIAEIDGAMPTLILSAKDGAGNDLTAVAVSMDGAPFVATLDGRAVAIDPGEHAFHFEAAGQPGLDKTFVVREGEKDRRETVVLGASAPSAPLAAPVAPPAPAAEASHFGAQKTIAVVAGGAGVAGIVVGAIFGAFASSVQNREKSDCSTSACPNHAQGVADYDAANQNATVSTVGFVAGGALVAAGVVLWLTAPSGRATPAGVRVSPALTANGARLGLEGSF